MGKIPAKSKAPAEWITLDPPEAKRTILLKDYAEPIVLFNVTAVTITDTKVWLKHGIDRICMYPKDQLVFVDFTATERTI